MNFLNIWLQFHKCWLPITFRMLSQGWLTECMRSCRAREAKFEPTLILNSCVTWNIRSSCTSHMSDLSPVMTVPWGKHVVSVYQMKFILIGHEQFPKGGEPCQAWQRLDCRNLQNQHLPRCTMKCVPTLFRSMAFKHTHSRAHKEHLPILGALTTQQHHSTLASRTSLGFSSCSCYILHVQYQPQMLLSMSVDTSKPACDDKGEAFPWHCKKYLAGHSE